MKKGIGLILAVFVLTPIVYGQLQFNEPPSGQQIINNIDIQPLCFTQNNGQWGDKTLYKAETGGATFYFCRDEVAYLFSRNTDELEESKFPEDPILNDKFNNPRHKKEAMIIKAQFIGANLDAEILGENRLPHDCNYFHGNDPSQWRTDVPNFSAVTYRNIWPGIDLRYHGNGTSIKYDFIINPGADISQIKIHYDGVENLGITNQGDLEAQTIFGHVYERIPEIYQEINGLKRGISGQYILREPGIFGFALEEDFNPAYPVVIDPELAYSTYLGGNSYDYGRAIAIDDSGNAYLTGTTSSYNFPVVNPYDSNYNYGSDIFIAKLSNAGSSLLYSTFLGGSGNEDGSAIALDSDGNVYITGGTESNNFPTINAFDSSLNGYTDVFIAKLSSSGNALIYSTYLGDSGTDYGRGIAVNESGNAVVVGFTSSSSFPVINAYDGVYNGGSCDAFITKLSVAGNALEFSTFFGGADVDYGLAIALDDSGNIYITGPTASLNLPLVDAYQDTLLGLFDVYVASFNTGGNVLRYCTYLGGTHEEQSLAIDVDNLGNAYIAGFTSSVDFPLANAFDPTYNSDYYDAFVTKFSWGNGLIYSTYLGGYYEDEAWGISVDGSGNAYVAGYTLATDFPVANPFQGESHGNSDIFVTKFDPNGDSLGYSTYLGGSGNDIGRGIAADEQGNVVIVGYSNSFNYPRLNAYDSTSNGDDDVVITKFGTPIGIDDQQPVLPNSCQFYQNYPNPFNAQTTIQYSLPAQSLVTIDIFDILGRKIETLAEGIKPAGDHQTTWDASGNSSGIYFYRIKAGEKTDTKRMTLLK